MVCYINEPPTPMENSIESRCILHPYSHGQNYREHLEKEHRPEVEA